MSVADYLLLFRDMWFSRRIPIFPQVHCGIEEFMNHTRM